MDQVSQIREKIDIVGLIQEYIPLKKAGRNFKALCPFHTDKTPSLVISPERQIWHCFGCGKGGDVFSFLMEYEHMEFPESLRILADRAGVELQNVSYDKSLSSKKERIYKLNNLAAEFYHFLLTRHKLGAKALEYVKSRNIKDATIKTYMLGYSPFGNALFAYLNKKKKYDLEDILDSGLVNRRGKDVVDFFQGRLMFPLFDHRGNNVGFSGRVLNNNDKTSKYINTRETLVYHKGMTFFGLNSAKESIKKQETAILMEGEFDVISSFQEGITNAVAVKGTALTQDQVNLLSRFCKKVELCFDADNAGQEALKRSLPILEKKSLTTSVIVLSGGKDPDELIKSDPIAFKKAIKNDIGAYDYLIEKTLEKFDKNSPTGKKQIGDELLPTFSFIDNDIVKEHYLKKLSEAISISYESLIKEMDKKQKEKIVNQIMPNMQKAKNREEKLEEYLLSLIVQHQDLQKVLDSIDEFLSLYKWNTQSIGKIIEHLKKNPKERTAKESIDSLPEELMPTFNICFLLPLPQFANPEEFDEEIQKTAQELLLLFAKTEIRRLGKEIEEKEKEGNKESLESLKNQLDRFLRLLGQKKI